MLLKINGTEIAEYPKEFKVTILDLDNAESTTRTADGTLNRDRTAVKRQIDMSWGLVEWAKTSQLLMSMNGIFFDFYYPDPESGIYVTKTFYVGNRPTPIAVEQNGKMYWSGLQVTLTER